MERNKKGKETIPTVKTWCLPEDINEEKLLVLHQGIVRVLKSFPQTGVKDEQDVLNLFPRDLMTYGLGTEIKIEITDLPWGCGRQVRTWVAREIGIFVSKMFEGANIFCTAECINPGTGVWSSR
jgi:hypothetical protein